MALFAISVAVSNLFFPSSLQYIVYNYLTIESPFPKGLGRFGWKPFETTVVPDCRELKHSLERYSYALEKLVRGINEMISEGLEGSHFDQMLSIVFRFEKNPGR